MQEKNFTWLLSALFVLLVGLPIIEVTEVVTPKVSRALVTSWLLIVGVWSLKGFGRLYPIGIVLAFSGVGLGIAAAHTLDEAFLYGSFCVMLAFLLVAIWCTGMTVFGGDTVSTNRIRGAICMYLLMGVAWAAVYTLIELTAPGSFSGIETRSGPEWDSAWLYFSFTTMSTLGYGDIVPVSPVARMVAYLQAVCGLMFVAVLVAGLVSGYVAIATKESPDSEP